MAEYYVAWAPHYDLAFVAGAEAAAKRAARVHAGVSDGRRITWPTMRKEGWRVSKIGDDADAG